MRRDMTLLAVSLLLLVVMSGFLAVDAASYVRTLVALPLMFVLPGLVMLRALRVELTTSARQVLVIGLSMAVTMLGGLLLSLGSWLTTWGWLLWFGMVTLGGALFTLGRGSADPIRWRFPRVRVRHFALCGAIAVVVVFTLQNAMRNHEAYLPFRYTDFWMLPDGQGSNLYIIGVRNGERVDENFTVRVMVDGAIVGTWPVTVAADQTITRALALPPGQKAVAWLLREKGQGEVYRSVSASLHGTAVARNP